MLAVQRFALKEMEVATNRFSSELLIGTGGFGVVYKGLLNTGDTVAIKRAKRDTFQNTQEFYNEVKLLAEIRHKNLVTLIGFCEEAGEQILVYEYIPNGSLLEHITGQTNVQFTWRQRVQIAIGAAKGIGHLHEECKPPIIHRDIKPSNILVDNQMEAKVSDFGLVRTGPLGGESHVSSLVKGTPGYMDPDYCSSYHLTPFSDVYSFGVILLQLVTAKPAVDLTKRQPRYNVIDWARPSLEQGNLENILDSSLLRQTYNRDMMLFMGQLGLRCVERSPKDRPTMRQICEELEFHLYSQILEPSRSLVNRQGENSINENEDSISLENIGLQKFEVEMENVSFDGTNMRSLECHSFRIYLSLNNSEQVNEVDDTNNTTINTFCFS
ncbi:putative serine/threonine-protein kinase [Cryptomeria japonica]|uniref:putative serine/threonine-protein kinase n=1 Tax=Cryptomeria japonica TaxID=3369 RepID=UPI0025ABAF2A|nr:putative serine/threonine-protein kinase [Cryptomeria japonica]